MSSLDQHVRGCVSSSYSSALERCLGTENRGSEDGDEELNDWLLLIGGKQWLVTKRKKKEDKAKKKKKKIKKKKDTNEKKKSIKGHFISL